MDRPYLDLTVDALEKLVLEHRSSCVVLAQLREELGFRRTDRAKQLRREVEALLAGQLPMPPKPARPDSPDDQLRLLKLPKPS